jgi:ABC-type transporter Mla subunit MlaD
MTPARLFAVLLVLMILVLVIAWPVASRVSQPQPTATATIPSIGGDATTQEWEP